LDERLASARALATAVRGEIALLGRRVEEVRADSERLDGELRLALQELEFIRREPWAMRRPGNAILADDPEDPEGRAVGSEEPAPDLLPGETGPPYERYTEARYRETVGALHARRRVLATGTIVVAALVSLGLLWVTWRFLASASNPWVVGLPVVWLLPVPFFVVAFFGSHRILSQRSLSLSEPS
jgi:hypothetical protein